MSTPKNFAGIAYPPEGENYVGMFFGSPKQTLQKNYREYLTCRLLSTLNKGEVYLFRFFAKPATNSKFLVDHLSFVFTADSLAIEHDNFIGDLDAYELPVNEIEVTEGWYEVELEFVADGTEQFLTIGDFIAPDKSTFKEMYASKSLLGGSSTYYLFDHFSLVSKEMTQFTIEKPFSLEKVYFDFDSHTLKEAGLEDLRQLADYLKLEKNLNLEIYGNTDTVGSDAYNNKLSVKRAESVKIQLEEYGIAAERIKTFGLGERQSIYQYDSLNRRTEFVLVPKVKSN